MSAASLNADGAVHLPSLTDSWVSDGCQLVVRWMSDRYRIRHIPVHKDTYTSETVASDAHTFFSAFPCGFKSAAVCRKDSSC